MSTLSSPSTANPTETLSKQSPEKKIWTDAEFMALPKDGHRYELVTENCIDMGNSGAKHGYVCSDLMILLADMSVSKN
jgi:hypothetical protein